MAELYINLLLALAWVGVLLKSNLLLYISNSRIFIRLGRLPLVISTLSIIIYTILNINTPENTIYILSPLITYLIIEVFFTYNSSNTEFRSLAGVREIYDQLAEDEPEMVVVRTSKIHVIPLKFLRSQDFIIKDKGQRSYSLSFCLLCNTTHAYFLPIINGRELDISSHGGSVLNGNKVLHDSSGKFIWQQFDGNPISGSEDPLDEIKVDRYLWAHIPDLFPNASYAMDRVNIFRYLLYKSVGKLFSKLNSFRMGYRKMDHTIPPKSLVSGIQILGTGSRAYPLIDFKPDKLQVFEDELGGKSFTVLFNGSSINAFDITGLELDSDRLRRGDDVWTIDGKSLGDHDDLSSFLITHRVYWYMWKQFHEDTDIYNFT